MSARIIATYHVTADAASIEARARGIAVEQSVEMPVEGIDDPWVLEGIVGRVEEIGEIAPGRYLVRIGLAAETVGGDAGQLFNMLFGNTSIQEGVELVDADLPDGILAAHPGPNIGTPGLRTRTGAFERAVTSGALKPQGLPAEALAAIAGRMAAGGIDLIKDDHGLADQPYSPFTARVDRVAEALDGVAARTGKRTRYIPSLSGNLDAMRGQIRHALSRGIAEFLIAPIIAGIPTFATLVREFPQAGFMTHPTLSGIARIAPPLFYGKLFRLLGADAVVYPNHGGRFGYSTATCLSLAANCRADWAAKRPCLPTPAGGMTTARISEMLDFYGADTILLIGGALLATRELLTQEVATFVDAVAAHRYS
ncbi:MAG: RuBisCO large subunit C-terminal-like domain-containing protein [Alphaproteobacteria bacterium]|nr:RuBisCO large subunit C-terminal-like domain-containing protein [Alphaproteobacteria bacterium]